MGELARVRLVYTLNSVEAAIPRCGRAIACLLTGSTDKNKKVGECPQSGIPKEKSLKIKGKKRGAIKKAFVAACWMTFGFSACPLDLGYGF